MNDNCRHYYHTHDSDSADVEYCKDCLVVLDVQPGWGGKLNIGKLNTYYDVSGASLDIKSLIEDHLGTSIDMLNVVVGGENSWNLQYMVQFQIGKNWMIANLEISKTFKYEPTGIFIEKPVVEEEVTT